MFSDLTTNFLLACQAFLGELTAEDWRAFTILAVFPLLLGLESVFARKEGHAAVYRQSYLANIGTLALNDTLLSLLSISSLWLIADRFAHFGLLADLENPTIKAILAFVGLDLVLYGWHRLNHTVDALWVFHKVHHSDRVMNVTTAFRLHVVEVFMTVAVKALFIMLIGIPAEMVLATEGIVTICIMFHHTNLSFRGEHWLSWFMIVPYAHRVHHSAAREEHDNNYGAVFSWWDRLFGTYKEVVPSEIGLYQVPGLNAVQLIKYGFIWNLPTEWKLDRDLGLSGSANLPAKPAFADMVNNYRSGQVLLNLMQEGLKRDIQKPSPHLLHRMIAEAAYYRAEKRGFAPGYDYMDWIEAERQIKGT